MEWERVKSFFKAYSQHLHEHKNPHGRWSLSGYLHLHIRLSVSPSINLTDAMLQGRQNSFWQYFNPFSASLYVSHVCKNSHVIFVIKIQLLKVLMTWGWSIILSFIQTSSLFSVYENLCLVMASLQLLMTVHWFHGFTAEWNSMFICNFK
jgi:hypothetical protein